MTLLLILLTIKHFIVDAPLQTPFQYTNKGTYGHAGGIQHALYHGFGTSMCFVWFEPLLLLCILAGVLDAVIHYHIDWAKMNISSAKYSKISTDANGKKCLCIYDNMFFMWLVADQCLHFITYITLINLQGLQWTL